MLGKHRHRLHLSVEPLSLGHHCIVDLLHLRLINVAVQLILREGGREGGREGEREGGREGGREREGRREGE